MTCCFVCSWGSAYTVTCCFVCLCVSCSVFFFCGGSEQDCSKRSWVYQRHKLSSKIKTCKMYNVWTLKHQRTKWTCNSAPSHDRHHWTSNDGITCRKLSEFILFMGSCFCFWRHEPRNSAWLLVKVLWHHAAQSAGGKIDGVWNKSHQMMSEVWGWQKLWQMEGQRVTMSTIPARVKGAKTKVGYIT